MVHWLITYAAVLATFILFDAGWITLVVRKLYDLEATEVIRDKPRKGPAALFYLIYPAGVTAFAVLPMTYHLDGIHAIMQTYLEVAAWGAGLGFFAYATFAFTNQAVIKGWNYKLVVTDLAWGSILTSLAAIAGFVVFRALA